MRQRQAAAAAATDSGIAVRPLGDMQPFRRSVRSAGVHIRSASVRMCVFPMERLVRVVHLGHCSTPSLQHPSGAMCDVLDNAWCS